MDQHAGVTEADIEAIASSLGELAQGLAGRRVLLTGAGGFLGRYFQATFAYLNREVLSEPVHVLALDNLITSSTALANGFTSEHIQFRVQDVCAPITDAGPLDYIIHAAGIASPFYYRAYPLQTLEVSVTGTRHLLELARANQARLVYFSSSEIYGDPDPRQVPIQESYRGNVACQGPRACYDESKRVGETLCYIFHQQHGVHTNTIRPFNVYGPGMQEADYRVMPNFASRIKAGLPLQVYGSGRQTRTFCYIADAINGFLRVLLKGVPGEAYNIGNPQPELGMLELAEAMLSAAGRELPIHLSEYPDSYPADEPRRRCPDIRKARLQLGYEPRMELAEGLRRFLSWSERVYRGVVH